MRSVVVTMLLLAGTGQANPALKIVIIEGEGAVNIIQQKTAVAPVIEVRDRNDQPVAGATVSFVVRAGRATFGGARTLTVTTNAAGRAAAAGFAPGGSGALQIGATATFQGQTAAAVTIAQTNVMTAAEAAAATSAGAGGSGGGAAAGGGAGSGGGVSGTTLGIVGGAVAAGAVVATQAKSDQPATPAARTFAADISGTVDITFALTDSAGPACTNIDHQTLAISIRLDSTEGSVTGTMRIDGDVTRTPGTCPSNEDNNYTTRNAWSLTGPVSGSPGNITATVAKTSSFSNSRSSGDVVDEFVFTGHVAGDSITGTLSYTTRNSYRNSNGVAGTGIGSTKYDTTLTPRQ